MYNEYQTILYKPKNEIKQLIMCSIKDCFSICANTNHIAQFWISYFSLVFFRILIDLLINAEQHVQPLTVEINELLH